jgi:DNA-binding response OmpR family regulator
METLQLFTRILSTSAEKFRVLQATTGEEALKMLHSRKVDLIILDLHLPGMNGFTFLEEKNRQASWNKIPVVILSAEDPSGHPMAVPGLVITHHQGLSVAQVFQYALRMGEPKAP